MGNKIYESVSMPRPIVLLTTKIYQTGIYNANTVGNLYYSNYYDWQAKNIESFIFQLAPEVFLQNGKKGELICLETNVNHLQEAMPFEEIEVNMYLEQLYTRGFKMYFEYYSLGKHSKRKLAYGYNIMLWSKRSNENAIPVAEKIPEKVLRAFMHKNMDEKITIK